MSSEVPMDTGSMVVAVTLPSSQFLPEQTYVINPAGEALSGHNIKFYFSDVQPTAMLRRVMDFQLFGDSASFRGRKCLVQGGKRMGVEVVHDKDDSVTVRIANIHQIFDFLSPVKGSAVLPNAYMPYATEGFHKYKYAAGAVTHIFAINLLGVSWTHGEWLSGLPQQLVRLFIHAYHWYGRVIGHLINVQNVFHTGYKFRVFFGRDTPVVIFVWSQFIFFNVRRIVSLPTGTSSSMRAFSSSSWSVQRECPSGAGLQAI